VKWLRSVSSALAGPNSILFPESNRPFDREKDDLFEMRKEFKAEQVDRPSMQRNVTAPALSSSSSATPCNLKRVARHDTDAQESCSDLDEDEQIVFDISAVQTNADDAAHSGTKKSMALPDKASSGSSRNSRLDSAVSRHSTFSTGSSIDGLDFDSYQRSSIIVVGAPGQLKQTQSDLEQLDLDLLEEGTPTSMTGKSARSPPTISLDDFLE